VLLRRLAGTQLTCWASDTSNLCVKHQKAWFGSTVVLVKPQPHVSMSKPHVVCLGTELCKHALMAACGHARCNLSASDFDGVCLWRCHHFQ
jgi:hypothetical protein